MDAKIAKLECQIEEAERHAFAKDTTESDKKYWLDKAKDLRDRITRLETGSAPSQNAGPSESQSGLAVAKVVRCYIDELGPISDPIDLMLEVPPIYIGCSLKDACSEAYVPESALEKFLIVHPEFKHDVALRVINVLRPWESHQGESGVIQLTDRAWSLVKFYHHSLGGVRNKQDSTTLGRKRADAVWYLNGVPVCRIEEKESSLVNAWADLTNKMKEWSPAVYSTQTWILAIASTMTHMEIGYFHAEKGQKSWRATKLCTLNMGTIAHRCKFVGIFLRFAKHLQGIEEQLLFRHCKLREIPDENVSSRHRVYLNECHVIKEYVSRPSHLDAFYEETKEIAGIEKKVASGPLSRKRTRSSGSVSMQTFYYELSPVGLDVLPSDYPTAILSLIATVQKLHEVGWAHLDIRWTNVIFEPIDGVYVLIDCEFARKIGDEVPHQSLKCLEALPSIPKKVCPEIDWHSLGKMISMIDRPSPQLLDFAKAFLSMDLEKIRLVLQYDLESEEQQELLSVIKFL